MGGLIPTTGFVREAVYIAGGFIGVKIAANTVMPMVGVTQPIARILVKGLLAGGFGFVGRRFLGQAVGNALMLGGLVETVNDAVQTYLAPYVPALSVSAYPELSYSGNDMSAYPELSGAVYEGVQEQV